MDYQDFIDLASDKSFKDFIVRSNPGLSENEIWHKYLELDNKAPYSNYAYGFGPSGSGKNEMAKLSEDLKNLKMGNVEKVKISNFVYTIISSSDYMKIGPALDQFGCFIREAHFESGILMDALLNFISSPLILEEYQVIMYSRIMQIFNSSDLFKGLSKIVKENPHCQIIAKKVDFLEKKKNKKGIDFSQSGFLKEVYLKYKRF